MGEWALSGARLLQFAATLTLFGSALFFLYGLEPQTLAPTQQPAPSWPRALLGMTAVIGVGSAIGWLLAEAVTLTGSWSAWRDVITGTRLGQMLTLRAGLLALSLIASLTMKSARRLWLIVGVLGGLSVTSFVWSGHGTLGSGHAALWHGLADGLHLLLAGTWLGALVPLSVLIVRWQLAPEAAHVRSIAQGLARFSALGPALIAVLILTGVVNAWYLIGSPYWKGLFRTTYGLALLVKLAFFACMLVLAAINRLRLTPRLQALRAESSPVESVLHKLRTTLLTETLLGLLVLCAVALLGTLQPPASAS